MGSAAIAFESKNGEWLGNGCTRGAGMWRFEIGGLFVLRLRCTRTPGDTLYELACGFDVTSIASTRTWFLDGQGSCLTAKSYGVFAESDRFFMPLAVVLWWKFAAQIRRKCDAKYWTVFYDCGIAESMRTKKKTELPLILAEGEGQKVEFKESPGRLDRELVAFANAVGGSIFLGSSGDSGIGP